MNDHLPTYLDWGYPFAIEYERWVLVCVCSINGTSYPHGPHYPISHEVVLDVAKP